VLKSDEYIFLLIEINSLIVLFHNLKNTKLYLLLIKFHSIMTRGGGEIVL